MTTIDQHCDLIDCGSRDAWLAERRNSIGASETAAILGEASPEHASAFSIWESKVNDPELFPPSERQQHGIGLEPYVISAYLQKFGGDVQQFPSHHLVRSKAMPYLHDSPDAIAHEPDRDGPGICQLKTWAEIDRKSWSDGPPLYIQIQCQHEMLVTGCGWAVVPVLFGNSSLERFYVDRNERFIDAMLPVLADFWLRVESRVPPVIDGSPATSRAIARLHPNDSGDAVALPADGDRIIQRWLRIKELLKRLEASKAECENWLKQSVGDATFGVTAGNQWVSWKTQERAAHQVSESRYRVLRTCKPQSTGTERPQTLLEKAS